MFRSMVNSMVLLGALLFSVNAVAADWKLAKEANGVTVYTKKVAGQKIKSMRGLTVIDAELQDIASLFDTDTAYEMWLSDIIVSKRVKRVTETKQYIYLVQSMPVIKNRDVVVLGEMTQDPDTKVLTVSVTNADNILKESDKYVRIPHLISTFKFTPRDDGKVDVLYELVADPGGKIPGMIANSFAVKAPYETLLNLRKLSSDLQQFVDPERKNPFVNAS